jgi:hypothetical protein
MGWIAADPREGHRRHMGTLGGANACGAVAMDARVGHGGIEMMP